MANTRQVRAGIVVQMVAIVAGLFCAVEGMVDGATEGLPAGGCAGPSYEIFKHGTLWKTEKSVWFNTRDDWTRFLYEAVREKKLTKQGSLLALAHSRIAGGHWLKPKKTRGPMKGYNLWGIRATTEWKKNKPYFYTGGLDFRYYSSASHGVGAWLFVMRNYPAAKEELYEASPGVQAYVLGLCNGKDGRRYMKCPGASQGALSSSYVKGWVSRLELTMDMARDSLRKQGYSI